MERVQFRGFLEPREFFSLGPAGIDEINRRRGRRLAYKRRVKEPWPGVKNRKDQEEGKERELNDNWTFRHMKGWLWRSNQGASEDKLGGANREWK